jgi:hypothetical protein
LPVKLENPPYDFEGAFRTLAHNQVQMLHILSTPNFTPHRTLIADLAIAHRLPTMASYRISSSEPG